ncbi:MAG: hypothetical protein AAFQ63_13970 [Cyanobacteria bacterium J06621_11]
MSLPQYANFSDAIRGTCQAWCKDKGYSGPFCQDGEWWAFPPNSVMPVRIRTVMSQSSSCWVRVYSVTLALFPDGSLVREAVLKSDD